MTETATETVDLATAILKQLTRLSVGSCSCGVKSPDIQWHDAGCRYRMIEEVRENVEALEQRRATQWRLRRDAEGSRDVARAAADALRREAKACGLPNPSAQDCPNMQEYGGGMDGERYHCDVCNKGYFLDYDDMR